MARWQAHRVEVVIASPRTIETIFRRHFARTEQAFRWSVSRWEDRQRQPRTSEAPDGSEVEWIYGRLIRHACFLGANDIFLHKTLAGVGKIKLHVNGVGHLFAALKEDLFDKILNKLVSENSNADALARAPQEANVGIIGGLKDEFSDITDRYSFRLQLTQGRSQAEREAVVRILKSTWTPPAHVAARQDAKHAMRVDARAIRHAPASALPDPARPPRTAGVIRYPKP